MSNDDSMWSQKGATLSDKSARQEFGLTQEEIIAAMRAGKLQFRECSMHGNPWYRLLRHQVESLVREKSGLDHLHKKKTAKGISRSQERSQKTDHSLESHRMATGRVDKGTLRITWRRGEPIHRRSRRFICSTR